VFVVWNSTIPVKQEGDVETRKRVQVRFSGRLHTDPAGTIAPGYPLFTSNNYYNDPEADVDQTGVFRWGDYSAVTVDPTNPVRAWIVNEKVNETIQWGSRIGCIGY
jgi:hypothetical protein